MVILSQLHEICAQLFANIAREYFHRILGAQLKRGKKMDVKINIQYILVVVFMAAYTVGVFMAPKSVLKTLHISPGGNGSLHLHSDN